ncbi:HAD family hydrolase [candidate division KSB1 bacterium]
MTELNNIKAVIFDWGDTLMRDFPDFKGPMAYWKKIMVMPGVVTALERLHKEYILCAASNAGDSDAVMMGEALARAGIRRYFRRIYTSKELGFSKPDERFFLVIAKRIRVKPEECLMVGNDYEKDIIPAKSIGMKTVLFLEMDYVKKFESADFKVHSIKEILSPDILDKE